MELSELIPTERVVDILHPKTNAPTGIKVMLISMNDPKLKNIKRKFLDEKMRLEARGKTMKTENVEEFDMLMLYTAITGWSWGKNPETGEECLWNGQKPDYNLKNAKEILQALTWMKAQILEELNDDSAFFSD